MTAAPWNLPISDLDAGIENSASDLSEFRDARVLVTGGTGFLGSWLVSSLLRANSVLQLGLHLVVLTRNPSSVPLVSGPFLTVLEGDVTSIPNPGEINVIVHGAATSSSVYGHGDGDPTRMAETIVGGTRALIDVASRYQARMLFLSSGAVYGSQVAPVGEDCRTGPDPLDPRTAYGQSKRLAETLCAAAFEAETVSTVIARLFTFVGPRIPLDIHFAVGNFLKDAIQGRPIVVKGDGSPRRSYLYTGDLPEWCWALLARGRSGVAYNVGSPDPVTIGELASATARLPRHPVEVEVLGRSNGESPSWYVPITDRFEAEFGVVVRTPLQEALRKTYVWAVENEAY